MKKMVLIVAFLILAVIGIRAYCIRLKAINACEKMIDLGCYNLATLNATGAEICFEMAVRDAKESGFNIEATGYPKKTIQYLENLANFMQAQSFLEDIRRDSKNEDVDNLIDMMRNSLANSGCALEDLKTSETELMRFSRQGHKAQAMKLLKEMRQLASNESIEMYIELFNAHLSKAHCSLAEIGCSSNVLKTLTKKGFVAEARKWLHEAKKAALVGCANDEIEYVYKYLALANISPAVIGTSKHDLSAIKAQGLIALSKRILKICYLK